MLGTGAAVVKALPAWARAPFFHSRRLHVDRLRAPNLAAAGPKPLTPARIDILLLMAADHESASSIGGPRHYAMLPDGALPSAVNLRCPVRLAGAESCRVAYLPMPPGRIFLQSCSMPPQRAGATLFWLRLDGVWMHVGTPLCG